MKTIEEFEAIYGKMLSAEHYIMLFGEQFREVIEHSWKWLRQMKPQWQVAWIEEDDEVFFSHLVIQSL